MGGVSVAIAESRTDSSFAIKMSSHDINENTGLLADYTSYDFGNDQGCCQRIITLLSSCFRNIGKCLQSSCFRDNIHNGATDDTQQPLCHEDLTYEQLKKEGVTHSSMKRCTKEKIETFFDGEYNDIVECQITANNKDDFQADKTLSKHMKKCYESVKRATVTEVWGQLNDLLRYESTMLSSDQIERLKDISLACNLLLKRQNETFEAYTQPKDMINNIETGDDFETLKACSKSDAVRDQIYELFIFDPQTTTLSPRLRDISHAYGLLLFHYRKQDPNFEHVKIKVQFEEDLKSEIISKFQLLFLEMVTVSPPFLLFVPDQYDDGCLNRTQLFTACNTKRKKEPHPFHVRTPIILNNYSGQLCVEGLVCKGVE